MKELSPFSADQYAPLLCLRGIKSWKHKGGFLHKDPNNGSQDIFLLLTFLLYALYFSSFFFFFKGLFFNFTPLEKKKKNSAAP